MEYNVNEHLKIDLTVEETLNKTYLTFISKLKTNNYHKTINVLKIPISQLDQLISDLLQIQREQQSQ